MENNRTTIRISVRNLVEFILRGGDLDNRRGKRAEREAMQAGSRIHRKLQRRMGAGYQAEVPLKYQVTMEGFDCVVEGRADGIFVEDDLVTIDEIKGSYRDLALLQEPVEVHKAQAMCYAYMYAAQQDLPKIQVRMTYCNLETEDLRYFRFSYDKKELEDWFGRLMGEYEKWARFQADWRNTRQESIRPLEFPFPYREGQKDLAYGVYRTIARKKRLFIQAPTGVGKTMSAVFPAVKAMGEGLGEKLFYLTAKTITRTVAEETFGILRRKGLRLKSVTLTAKEKLCICQETDCNPEHCPYALGHYDRVNDAVYSLLTEGPDDLNRETLLAWADKHRVCPFEMSLDVSSWTDAVICDYNYVFDPNVRLKRFFSEGMKGEYLFLIDEAHNLVERGREMFSASLCKEDFLQLKRKVKGRYRKAERALERCNRYLLDLKRECVTYQIHEDVGAFSLMVMSLMGELETLLEEGLEPELQKEVQEFWFRLRDFLNIFDRLDENYVIYSELMEDGHFRLKLFCVETAVNLRECLDKGNSTVFFSATLLPMPYYKHLLGAEEDYAVYARSPFSQEQRLLLIGRDVSSRYTRRSRREYERIAGYLYSLAEGKKGNYLLFFPSYKMMLEVYEAFLDLYGEDKAECLLQSAGMNEEKREEFLKIFQENAGVREKSHLGFCVMGGIFSEGIDLKGDALIGAAVIGTGLPLVCHEREILKTFYEERGMDGFAYAYRYPGMNKVLQAAGRVIRTPEDQGVVLLLDERFLNSEYKRLFPLEWEDYQVCGLSQSGELMERFWKNREP
ncbi:MAG: ATP-dependent DNA helicase [Lachnospiraceae bacterium]|jgi:DNA excision repair protein ERCC-2|nr:ATP-dependent DNA helicase [Lachnospiraceae bacterium]